MLKVLSLNRQDDDDDDDDNVNNDKIKYIVAMGENSLELNPRIHIRLRQFSCVIFGKVSLVFYRDRRGKGGI